MATGTDPTPLIELLHRYYGDMATGMNEAIRVFQCGHEVRTGLPLRVFRTSKGELTECPKGCGVQRTQQVKSGKPITDNEWANTWWSAKSV